MSNTRDHRRFCENDGWELFKSTDHDFYRKRLEDGSYKITKISRGYQDYSKGLFARILKDQLQVSRDEFNRKI